MYGLVVPVWAGPGSNDFAEEITESTAEELSPQVEDALDTLDAVTIEQATEYSTGIVDADVSNAEAARIDTKSSEVDEMEEGLLIKDIVLVLDNSGSMKKNDPQFLTKQAVTEFINNLDESTRVAIVIFDQDVRTTVPLTEISSASRQGLLDSLSQINYKGLYTNSPAAIESAIYDLKNNGRGEARKIIVFYDRWYC